MPLLHPKGADWEGPVYLATDEVWQSRGKATTLLSTAPNPGLEDGIELSQKEGLSLGAGLSVFYRKAADDDGKGFARIAREATSAPRPVTL